MVPAAGQALLALELVEAWLQMRPAGVVAPSSPLTC